MKRSCPQNNREKQTIEAPTWPSPKTRGQGTFEYVIMVAGVLLLISLVAFFLMNNVLAPQTKTLGNQSDQIKDYKKQLQQQTDVRQPTPTPTPSGPPPQP